LKESCRELSKGEEIPTKKNILVSKDEELKSSSVTNEGVNDAANAFKNSNIYCYRLSYAV
jgi:hypothetical protein